MIFLYVSCEKEEYDYRKSSKWTGVYDCEKNYAREYWTEYWRGETNSVIVDIFFMSDEDSALYVRERRIYDFIENPHNTSFAIQCPVKINVDGSFASDTISGDCVEGYIRNDSLYMTWGDFDYKGFRIADEISI